MYLSLIERFWAKVNKNGPIIKPELGPCWIWTGALSDNRSPIINIGNGIGLIRASRLSWIIAGFELPEEADICHECDNPGCVNPAHLFLGTAQTNSTDMVSKGRSNRGESRPLHKLTEAQVLEIRQSTKRGVDLSRIYGVNQNTISQIRSGKLWKYLNLVTSRQA
jgi:hypothetical protein